MDAAEPTVLALQWATLAQAIDGTVAFAVEAYRTTVLKAFAAFEAHPSLLA